MSLVDDVRARKTRVAARLMRDLDDSIPGAVEHLKALYPYTGHAGIVGVTGNPGSGKSSLVDALVASYRQEGKTVGVVAIDPSSPFSGGAVLGDRIRMQKHALDEGVFIRSLASRGHLGGLSRSTNDVVTVLDAMGFDIILIETVGVGQAEVDVVEAAHVSVVVVVPGLGDEVQALKAGILEIGDVLCVNKADRPGADRAVQDLEQMLGLRQTDAPRPPVLRTTATTGAGVDALKTAIDEHLGHRGGPAWEARLRRRARRQLEDLLKTGAARQIFAHVAPRLDELVEAIAAREADPYSLAEQILADAIELERPTGASGLTPLR